MRFDGEVRAFIAAASIIVGVVAAYAVFYDSGTLVLAVLGDRGELGGYPARVYEGGIVEFKLLVENGAGTPGLFEVRAYKGCSPRAEGDPVWQKAFVAAPGDSIMLDYKGVAGGSGCSREYVVFRLYEYSSGGWSYAGREVYVSYTVVPLGGGVGG